MPPLNVASAQTFRVGLYAKQIDAHTLDNADAVPHAVPRTSVTKSSGVILQGTINYSPGNYERNCTRIK